MTEPKFPPDKLFRYPHMFPLDIVIWERFLDKFSQDYDGFTYDIKVGTGVEIPEDVPEQYQRMMEVLSKYRIDVLGFLPGRLEILEVKPEASSIALGQVITYIELFKRDFKPSLPVTGCIVTDISKPDMAHMCDSLQIRLVIV